jgi:hypothetical protein
LIEWVLDEIVSTALENFSSDDWLNPFRVKAASRAQETDAR